MGNRGSDGGADGSSKYDNIFVLNTSSALKIERIVARVTSLAKKRFSAGSFAKDWFRHMVDPCHADAVEDLALAAAAADSETAAAAPGRAARRAGAKGGARPGGRRPGPSPSPSSSRSSSPTAFPSSAAGLGPDPVEDAPVIGDPQLARPPPFLPFSAFLITGTAGAGKTSSVQTLAANLDCVITGSTVISSQALSSALNRARSAQVRTIFKEFGFNSRHVSLSDRIYLRHRDGVSFENVEPIQEQQWRDLSVYWPVLSDIVRRTLQAGGGLGRVSKDVGEFCRSNVIVIDECGIVLRYLLHVVVFFYYFYNAVADSELYRSRAMPCIVCVGSPTQTEALESHYDHRTQNRAVQRGLDVLSALIGDPVLSEYCRTSENWVMFINNKRCRDPDFGNLLKHIEFGLPLSPRHVEYVDRFVRPVGFVRSPAHVMEATRLFVSHREVKDYFTALHEYIRADNRHLVFELPIYCLLNNEAFARYCDSMGPDVTPPTPEAWFRANLARIGNYSQFTDQNISAATEVHELSDLVETEGGRCEVVRETLLSCRITFIRESSVAVTNKMRACVIGYSGTFESFAEILQKDLFLEKTPCEQALYAYSLLSGLLFSAMYLFYSSSFATDEILVEFARIALPDVPALRVDDGDDAAARDGDEAEGGRLGRVVTDRIGGHGGERGEDGDHGLDEEITDLEMVCGSDIYTDAFFVKYPVPPSPFKISFEDAVQIYTTFRDVFLARYRIMQQRSRGGFGRSPLITYNRRNVWRKKSCEITSHNRTFVGMLTYVSPNNSYVLEGFTNDHVSAMHPERLRIHPKILERGLPRLLVRDACGFVFALDHNVSRFSDYVEGKTAHICTMVDYGVTSLMAMTIAKSQGLTLQTVAVDFGETKKPLRMSHVYVAISRVVDPDRLFMSLNPFRFPHDGHGRIVPYIRRAVQDRRTTLIF